MGLGGTGIYATLIAVVTANANLESFRTGV